MAALQKIQNNVVINASNDQEVEMSTFWSEGRCVIFFMRRFG